MPVAFKHIGLRQFCLLSRADPEFLEMEIGSSLLLTLAQLREFFNPLFEPPIGGYQRLHSLDHAAHRAVLGDMKLAADTLQAIAPQTPGQIDSHIPRFVDHPPPGMEQLGLADIVELTDSPLDPLVIRRKLPPLGYLVITLT